jgi:hypothetical protein
MLRRALATIVPLLTIAIIAPPSQAATTHSLKLTIKDSTITSQGDRPGARQHTAGLVSGNPLGAGVESISDRVASATSTNFTFQGTITIYTTDGTLAATIKFTVTPTSSGGANVTGGGDFTGGTGRYAGARGHFHATGSETANSSVLIAHARGSLSY